MNNPIFPNNLGPSKWEWETPDPPNDTPAASKQVTNDTPADIPRILRVYITIPGFFQVVPSNHNDKTELRFDSLIHSAQGTHCHDVQHLLQTWNLGRSLHPSTQLKVLDQSPGIEKWWELSWQVPCDVWKTLGNFPRFSPPIGTKFAIWLKNAQKSIQLFLVSPFFLYRKDFPKQTLNVKHHVLIDYKWMQWLRSNCICQSHSWKRNISFRIHPSKSNGWNLKNHPVEKGKSSSIHLHV